MIAYPQFDPILVQIGPLAIRWYGLMYALAFLLGWPLLQKRAARFAPTVSAEALSDLMLWIVIGVVAGGRLGYILFYKGGYYLDNPLAALRIWEGGMSFHGGMLGVLLAGYLFCRRHGLSFLAMADVVIPVVPVGLLLGRIGNFINGELWGRPTDLPWAMVFPFADAQPRHPSQLYEAFLEGVCLFALLWWVGRRPRPAGYLLGLFLLGYGVARTVVEWAREPDAHLGFLSLGLSMGQWLSLPMVLMGGVLMLLAARRPAGPPVEP